MFGYVIVNTKNLSEEAQARYGAAYCGLCRRLGERHGLRGRLTLSYDLTFLDLLLCSLYEGESEAHSGSGHCPIHPVGKKDWRYAGPTDYCADMSVALHYYAALDKWQDDRSLPGWGFAKALGSRLPAIEQQWPRQCAAIREGLAALAACEAENCTELDKAAGCFGDLMAALFDYRQDHWSGELRTLGYNLGKFIYLLDAYDDLPRDEKKGSYNPLRTVSAQPDYHETVREMLELLMATASRAFERLPCVEDTDLLRNILYSGVWMRYSAVASREKKK